MTEAFLPWGKGVVDCAARRLEAEIPGARLTTVRSRPDYRAVYVHFQDVHIPQSLAIWLYATLEGASFNIRNYGNVIGVGLKYDTDEELERGVWKLRRLSLFTWHKHVDERWEGFRWLCRAGDLPPDPQEAGEQIAARVLAALRRSGAIPE